MSDLIREAPIGQIIRWVTGNKLLPYPEEKSDFELPTEYTTALNNGEKPLRKPSNASSDTPTPLERIQTKTSRDAHDDLKPLSLTRTKSRAATIPFSEERLEVEQELALERTKTIPIAPTKTAEGNILVDWYTTDDPANPQNWSYIKRGSVSLLICLYTFAVYTGSAIYTSSEGGVIQKFGINPTDASLPLSLYVLAYGMGPLLFAPLSEIPAVGRNPVYVATFTIFVILSIPTALVNNFAGLLVLRFLQGFFGSPCLANGGATMQDMYSLLNLPYALTVWVAAAYCGPALGPLLSGFAVTAKGWRWSLWEILWIAGPILILMFLFVPETSTPNILLRRAARLRKLTGDSRLQAQSEIDQKGLKPSAVIVDALIKPIEITIKDPAIAFVNLYTSIVYGIYYSFFEVFPLVYPGMYGFSLGITGVVFTCILVSCLIGIAVYTAYLRWYLIPDILRNGLRAQESRLVPALFGCFGPPIGLFLFAWTANPNIHWIASVIGITIYGATVFVVMQCIFLYVPLSYPQFAASLFAGNDFFRSALACGSILFARPLFNNLGVARGTSLLAGLSTLGVIGMFALYFMGFEKYSRADYASAIDKGNPTFVELPIKSGLLVSRILNIRYPRSFLRNLSVSMVSASKAARLAKRAEAGDEKKKTPTSKLSSKAASKTGSSASSVNGDETPPLLDGDGNALPDDEQPATDSKKASTVKKLTEQMDKHGLSDRVTTGVLASLAASRDVKINAASLVFHGKVLITDTTLELNYGRRYGLLGENGCGKSTLLKAIDKREYPIPEHVDIYLLNEGAPPSDLGALEWVVKEAENEMQRLDKLAEEILEKNGPEDPILEDLYERMETMDPSTFQTRASLILTGLGFNKVTIHKRTKDMSGGWRMRVALAKALFVKPSLLLLDDPTAHLDLEACVWLEEYLKKWDRTLILVSHSMDFLNGVCTNMIDMRMRQLIYYGGNYDSYIKTRSEQETNQMKAYAKQQEEIAHIKKFIASAGTYANLVRQAKSRQKILDKMEADGFIQPVHQDRIFTFRFADVEKLPPPVLSFDNVTFSYSGSAKDNLYENLDLGVDMDSRTALVGPNGVGKSTLLRLMTGKLSPTGGVVNRHTHLKLGLYSQHSAEQLDLTKSALDFVRDKYAEKSQDYQYWRQQLGKYGLSGESQTALMGTLSEGQKSRIVFALLAIEGPNMLLLDEPTNGLDIPTIDSLADAINAFSGGVVVVSHDFRLLDKIAKDIMVCENKTIRRWDGSIGGYKNYLRKKMVSQGQV